MKNVMKFDSLTHYQIITRFQNTFSDIEQKQLLLGQYKLTWISNKKAKIVFDL